MPHSSRAHSQRERLSREHEVTNTVSVHHESLRLPAQHQPFWVNEIAEVLEVDALISRMPNSARMWFTGGDLKALCDLMRACTTFISCPYSALGIVVMPCTRVTPQLAVLDIMARNLSVQGHCKRIQIHVCHHSIPHECPQTSFMEPCLLHSIHAIFIQPAPDMYGLTSWLHSCHKALLKLASQAYGLLDQ